MKNTLCWLVQVLLKKNSKFELFIVCMSKMELKGHNATKPTYTNPYNLRYQVNEAGSVKVGIGASAIKIE